MLGACLLVWGVVAASAAGSGGGLIAFSRCGPDGCGNGTDIWVIRENGSGLRRVTRTARHNDFPAWSPDGTRLAFARSSGVSTEIWTMSPSGGHQRRLTPPGAVDQQPAWSPDGKRIAFVRERSDRHGEIWVVDTSRHLVQLTHRSGDYRRPTWSPDGRHLAFAFARDPEHGRYAIYEIGADGRGERMLVRDKAHDYWDPSWSPDGRRLAFSLLIPHGRTFSGNLELVGSDGRGQRTVLAAPKGTVYFSPSWSPDGRRLAFVALSSRTGLGQLRFVNTDATGLRVLAQIMSDNRSPAWKP